MEIKKSFAGFATVLGMTVALATGLFARETTAEENLLTVVSFGGAYQAAQHKAYMVPFAAATGVKVVEGEYNGDYGLLRVRATAASPTWDVVSVESGPALRGQIEGMFAPLPDTLLAELPLVTQARRPAAAGHLMFATILGYNTDGAGPKPTNWQDLWNTKTLPGKRGLRNNPRGTLEIALLADGVATDKLYPLDVDRAFRKLDKIRDDLVFWDSGAQPLQLLANHVVAMTSVYNGRIWDARQKEKMPVAWTMSQGLFELEFWAVPKNSAHKKEAFQFIRYSLEKQQQADFSNAIAYAPTNTESISLISPEVKSSLPSGDGDQVIVDAEWWAANEDKVSARWETWKLGK